MLGGVSGVASAKLGHDLKRYTPPNALFLSLPTFFYNDCQLVGCRKTLPILHAQRITIMPLQSNSIWTGTTVVHPTHMYLKLTAHTEANEPLLYCHIPSAIDQALAALFGVVGSACMWYEMVDKSQNDGNAILRVLVEQHQQFWAALTVLSTFRGTIIRFTITRATPYLFAIDS